jgi:hypothetical protein
MSLVREREAHGHSRKVKLPLAAIIMSALILGIFFTLPGSVNAIGIQKKLTTTSYYDRNPSILKASDGTWWLTFSRSQTGTTSPRTSDNVEDYAVYYKTSTDGGATWSADNNKIADSSKNQWESAVIEDTTNGRIYIFHLDRKDNTIRHHYTEDNGATWTAGTEISPGPGGGGHFDAIIDNTGKIWVFYDPSDGITYRTSTDGGQTWSTPAIIPGTRGRNIPKALLVGSTIYVSFIHGWTAGSNIVEYAYTSDGGANWNGPTVIVSAESGIMHCDPVLYRDNAGTMWLFWAPWSDPSAGGDDAQWIERVKLDGTERIMVTSRDAGLWDYWPDVTQDSTGNLLMFFASEQSQGAIWMMNLGKPGTQKQESVTDDKMDAKAEADAEVAVSGGPTTVTALEYTSNPGGTPPFTAVGKYWDVSISTDVGVTSVTLRFYYTDADIAGFVESSLRAYWWTGSAWVLCNPQTLHTEAVDGYSGYIEVGPILASGTTPTLGQLMGTPFAFGGETPAPPLPKPPPYPVGGILTPVNKLVILAPYLALIGLAAVAAVAVKKRKH